MSDNVLLCLVCCALSALSAGGWLVATVRLHRSHLEQYARVLAFSEALLDQLHARDSYEAAQATALREAYRRPSSSADLGKPIPVPPMAKQGMGDLLAGRDAMRAAGLNPDNQDDVDEWERSLGPSPLGGGT